METKIATTIEQSKKLIELGLSADTADMWRVKHYLIAKNQELDKPSDDEINDVFPAWSLSALLEVYPMAVGKDMDMYCCWQNNKNLHSKHYDNPTDAVFEMIIKLHEQKLL